MPLSLLLLFPAEVEDAAAAAAEDWRRAAINCRFSLEDALVNMVIDDDTQQRCCGVGVRLCRDESSHTAMTATRNFEMFRPLNAGVSTRWPLITRSSRERLSLCVHGGVKCGFGFET